ncbi:MAG: dihydroxyacetone kinase phosphoryl donor subunit DhaM [Synergistaceae bacterium]|nr:dihydroxyacetone kinase phosphoryl donor subunit DhaM [Synergistaceae bacterium]
MRVGILIVSHSEDAARGIAQIATAMSGGNVEVVGVGGDGEGGLGVPVVKVLDALSLMLPKTEGIAVFPDLGSSILSVRGALEMLPPDEAAKVTIVDAPILEGAMLGAVEANCGAALEQVVESGKEARDLKKTEH